MVDFEKSRERRLQRARTYTGLYALFSLALIYHINDLSGLFNVGFGDQFGWVMTLVQALQNLVAGIFMLKILQKEGHVSSCEKLAPLFFIAEAFADVTYGIHYYLLGYAYRNTPFLMVHQGPFILSVAALAYVSIRRSFQGVSGIFKAWVTILVAAVSGVYFICSYKMVLSFPFPPGYNRPVLNLITSYMYGIAQAAAVGGIVIASLRAPSKLELHYWFLIIALNSVDFVLRIQDVRKVQAGIVFRYGYVVAISGVSCILLSRLLKTEKGSSAFGPLPTPLNSIRVLVPLSTLVILGLFILINSAVLPYFTVINIQTTSGHALSFAFVWLAANEIGLFLSRMIQKRIEHLQTQIELSDNLGDLGKIEGDLVELNPIILSLKKMKSQLTQNLEEISQARSLSAVADAAAKLIHRIKSPLTALEMVEGLIPVSLQPSVRMSVKDLKGIVADLKIHADHISLENYNFGEVSVVCQPTVSKVKLSEIIKNTVEQKQREMGENSKILISLEMDARAKNLYSELSPSEFSGLLSDLLNNSVQSILSTGVVRVRLVELGDKNMIQIVDNGKGIPSEIVKDIGTLGFTFDKPEGTGRGVYDAKKSVEGWEGNFSIASEKGAGTVVSIELNRCAPPKEKLSRILVPQDGVICVVDDSLSMREFWRLKLAEGKDKMSSSMVLLENPSDFSHWVATNQGSSSKNNIIYLIDYEYENSIETGLDLIEAAEIAGNSILVTGMANTERVINRCTELGVRFMTKTEAKSVSFYTDSSI